MMRLSTTIRCALGTLALAHLLSAQLYEHVLTILNPNPGPYDAFGASVAVAGNRIWVGGQMRTVAGASEAGQVYVFDRTTGALLYTIPNPAPAFANNFGASIAAAGNKIAVGVPGDARNPIAGHLYVYDAASAQLLFRIDNPNLAATTSSAPP